MRRRTLIFVFGHAGNPRILAGGGRGAQPWAVAAQSSARRRGRSWLSGVLARGPAAQSGHTQPGAGIAGTLLRSQKEDSARCVSLAGLAAGGVLPDDAVYAGEYPRL